MRVPLGYGRPGAAVGTGRPPGKSKCCAFLCAPRGLRPGNRKAVGGVVFVCQACCLSSSVKHSPEGGS